VCWCLYYFRFLVFRILFPELPAECSPQKILSKSCLELTNSSGDLEVTTSGHMTNNNIALGSEIPQSAEIEDKNTEDW